MDHDNGQKVGILHDIGSRLARLDVLVSDLTKVTESLRASNDAFHDRLEMRLREVERKQDMDLGIAQHRQRFRAWIAASAGIAAAASGWVVYFMGGGT